MMEDTLLILQFGIPLYSARGLTQTLAPIEQATQLRRTINGGLLDVSYLPFRKYQSKISCNDQRSPAIDGIWPGQIVDVSCVAELAYPSSGTPQRTVVDGSTRVEEGFTFYRPYLTMRVKAINVNTDEWGATVSWSVDLEEI